MIGFQLWTYLVLEARSKRQKDIEIIFCQFLPVCVIFSIRSRRRSINAFKVNNFCASTLASKNKSHHKLRLVVLLQQEYQIRCSVLIIMSRTLLFCSLKSEYLHWTEFLIPSGYHWQCDQFFSVYNFWNFIAMKYGYLNRTEFLIPIGHRYQCDQLFSVYNISNLIAIFDKILELKVAECLPAVATAVFMIMVIF